jgi:hypothetical protein
LHRLISSAGNESPSALISEQEDGIQSRKPTFNC